jgi:hypothetical protein
LVKLILGLKKGGIMKKRKKLNKKYSKKLFTKKSGSHIKNTGINPMRGGIRL